MNNPLHLDLDELHNTSTHEPHTVDASFGLKAVDGTPEHRDPLDIAAGDACEPLGWDEIDDKPYDFRGCTHGAGGRHG